MELRDRRVTVCTHRRSVCATFRRQIQSEAQWVGEPVRFRPCLDCGTLTTGSRCALCAGARSVPRRAYKAQRYNASYAATRRTWQARLDQGQVVACSRCGEPVDPAGWDLDHHPTLGLWPSHPPCNRSAGGRNEP